MKLPTSLIRFLIFFLIIITLFFIIEIVPMAVQREDFFTHHFLQELRDRAPRMLLVALAAAFILSRRMRPKNEENGPQSPQRSAQNTRNRE